MNRSVLQTLALAGLSLLFLTGCAGKSASTADLMRGHAVDAQNQADLKEQLAKDWEKGDKLVQTGEKRVEDGENRIKKAEQDLKKGQEEMEQGNREIAEGKKLMLESEQRFRENFPALPLPVK